MKRSWMWIGMAGAFLFAVLAAPAQVRVTKSAGAKSSLDVSGFASAPGGAAQVFRQTLENDLMRSGWFSLRRGKSEFALLGSAEDRGGDVKVECRVYDTASQRAHLSKSYGKSGDQARKLGHTVADDIIQALTGQPGIFSTRIAMVGTMSGAKELYVCDADGGNMVQLTRDNSVSVGPAWSPKGESIFYTSYIRRFPDVYEVQLASGRRDAIANHPGLNTSPAVAPNGKDVALILSKDGNPELYIKNLANGRLSRVTNTPRATEASPTWSPDGSQIAYVSDQSGKPQVYVVSRNGGSGKRLTSRGFENVSPDWGPNGLVAYSTRLGGRYVVEIIDPKSGQITQPPQDYADFEDPSWAPDGRHIACSRTERYNSKVYILDSGGDPPVALTDHKGDWFSPAWSPK